MTSSATQTEAEAHEEGEEGLRERLRRWMGTRTEVIAAGSLVVAGWILVLAINRWHVGAPQVFLCLGWLSIVSAGRLLWISAMRAGNELEGAPEDPEPVDHSRSGELEREKKALLKAIKEVEFDREVRARLALAGVKARVKASANTAAAEPKTEVAAEDEEAKP